MSTRNRIGLTLKNPKCQQASETSNPHHQVINRTPCTRVPIYPFGPATATTNAGTDTLLTSASDH